MSYKTATFRRNGNKKMADSIRQSALDNNLTVSNFSAAGWVLKAITITVFGHESDIKSFEKNLPDGVES